MPKGNIIRGVYAVSEICKQCGGVFTCDIKEGQKNCWCQDFINTIPIRKTSEDCLCPACLKKLLKNLS